MICAHCEKHFATNDITYVRKDGKCVSLSFCCYNCYLNFWKGINGFKPFPEYKGGIKCKYTHAKK